MRAAVAGMKTGRSLGHVAAAIAPSGWKKNWHEPANRFWKISIDWRAIRRLPCPRNRMAAVHRRIVLAKDENKDEYNTYLHIMMRQFVP